MRLMERAPPSHRAPTHVKVLFYLDKDKDDYPPEDVESLWAVPLGDGTYRLDNIPFFAPSIAFEDVIAVTEDPDGFLVFKDLVREGGHSTVRVLCWNPEDVVEARKDFEALGCSSEKSNLPRLFAVDIPPEVDYRKVRTFLQEGAEQEKWDFEESCIASSRPVSVILTGREEKRLRERLDRTRSLGPRNRRFSDAYLALARFLCDRGAVDEAIELYKEALAKLEACGADQEDWARMASALAVQWTQYGQYSKAEPILEKVRRVQEDRFGRSSPEWLETLHNKAALFHLRGQLQEAERLYQDALEGRERLLGGDHWATATTRSNLGSLYLARGEFTLAERLLRKAVSSFGEGHDSPALAISALMNLADLHAHRDQWEEVIRLNERALDLAREHLPEHNPLVGEVLSVLAAAEHSWGRDLDRAEQLYRQALEIEEKVLEGGTESFADTLEGLGAVLYTMGRPGREGEVREILERSVEVRTSVSGPQDPDLAPALTRLAWLYSATGDDHRAEQTWKRVLGLLRPIAAVDKERWSDALDAFAAWLDSVGREEEAQEIRQEASQEAPIPQ